jgi:phage terminase Nu1 subunit (DNA packaging protein)
MNLDAPCTQAAFGELIGVGQPAVSDMVARQVLRPGDTARQWLLAYCAHMREQAAGRGADGELAFQRSELARVSRERAEIKLAKERGEYAEVALIEQVLATVGRGIVGALEPLHVTLHRQCPALTPEDLKLIQTEVARACDLAASASLALLDVPEEDAEPGADGPGRDDADADPDPDDDEA